MEGHSPTKAPTAVQRHKTAFFFHIFEVSVTGCVREIRKEGNENLERTRCADVSIRNMLTFASTLSAHLVAMFFLHLHLFLLLLQSCVFCCIMFYRWSHSVPAAFSSVDSVFSSVIAFFIPSRPLFDFTPSLGPLAVSSRIYCWVSPAKIAVHWDCCNAFVFS